MPDSFTHVTHQSWGSRLGGSIKGVCCGIVFVVLSLWLLVWNEGNSVAAHKSLYEGEKLCQELSGTDQVDTDYEGKLVHVSGFAEAGSDVADNLFGVLLTETLKLKRSVEMFQWVEKSSSHTEKNTGGSTTTSTTYTYTKEWKPYAVSSSGFAHPEDHENPAMLFDEYVSVADPMNFGAFTLSGVISGKMNWYRPVATPLSVDNIPEDTKEGLSISKYQDKGFFVGTGSQASPNIGDTRVTFNSVPQQTISVIARQTSNSFSEYTTSNGRSIVLVEAGSVSAEEMFLHANAAVTFTTWLIRFAGLLVLWASLHNIVRPLSVFADVLPFLGDCVEGLSSIVSFLVALAIWLVTIALAWLAYRPFLSLSLLAIVGGGAYNFYKKRREQGGGAVPVAQAFPVSTTDDLEMQAKY